MQTGLIFFCGIASGFMGSTVGSGGAIGLPLLLLCGLSPQVAAGTQNFADFFSVLTALIRYIRAKMVEWKLAFFLVPITAIGAYLGSHIGIALSGESLQRYIGIVVFVLAGIFILNPKLGLTRRKLNVYFQGLGFALVLLAAINAGAVPAGGATLLLVVITVFLGREMVAGYATLTVPMLARISVAGIVYISNGFFDLSAGLALAAGSIIGASIGSGLAIKKGNRWVRGIFIVVALTLAIILIFKQF